VGGEQFGWSARDGVAVVHPAGELDLATVGQLKDCCQAAVDSVGPNVVVDLAETTFLDSSALGVFVGVAKQVEASGGWLRLAAVRHDAVRKVVEITRVDASLGDYPTVEDAISAPA
jgi:anti-sigma B factor antagonist